MTKKVQNVDGFFFLLFFHLNFIFFWKMYTFLGKYQEKISMFGQKNFLSHLRLNEVPIVDKKN